MRRRRDGNEICLNGTQKPRRAANSRRVNGEHHFRVGKLLENWTARKKDSYFLMSLGGRRRRADKIKLVWEAEIHNEGGLLNF